MTASCGDVQRCTLLGALLPDDVFAMALKGVGDASTLRPDEHDALGTVSAPRRAEFAAGRRCAHQALMLLQRDTASLTRADDRRPRWPTGVVGCITHTRGYTAAAVADSIRYAAIGIDVEARDALSQDLWRYVLHDDEIAWVGRWPRGQRRAAATLLFSAKEALHKSRTPSIAALSDFRQVTLMLLGNSLTHGSLAVTRIGIARYSGSGCGHRPVGFTTDARRVMTAVVVPASDRPVRY